MFTGVDIVSAASQNTRENYGGSVSVAGEGGRGRGSKGRTSSSGRGRSSSGRREREEREGKKEERGGQRGEWGARARNRGPRAARNRPRLTPSELGTCTCIYMVCVVRRMMYVCSEKDDMCV